MKPVHEKVATSEFMPGRTYSIALNGRSLYEAEVVKFHGGCWATVKVQKPLDEALAKDYTPGMEFDIKVANYEITLPQE